MSITATLRFRILARDGHACVYCGARPPDVRLVIDHVVPRALGGTDDPSNLAAACDLCNIGKGGDPADTPIEQRVIPAAGNAHRFVAPPADALPTPSTRFRGPKRGSRIHVSHFVTRPDQYGTQRVLTPCGLRMHWPFEDLVWLPDVTAPTCGMCVTVPERLLIRP